MLSPSMTRTTLAGTDDDGETAAGAIVVSVPVHAMAMNNTPMIRVQSPKGASRLMERIISRGSRYNRVSESSVWATSEKAVAGLTGANCGQPTMTVPELA